MPRVTLITHDGQVHDVPATPGQSLMRAAVTDGLPGIDDDGRCGCACGIRRVCVEAPWAEELPAQGQSELDILDLSVERRDALNRSDPMLFENDTVGLVFERLRREVPVHLAHSPLTGTFWSPRMKSAMPSCAEWPCA